MKVYSNLFSSICTFGNFRLAWVKATKGKKHYSDVKAIRRYGVNRYLRELLEEVREKRYKVSKYEIFQLYTGRKWREIYKLPMKDRIVQHAIMNYLEPIFRETFILDTYSSIKTRGIHLALQRVKKALRKGNYTYYAKLDVHKCYPSLDKEILKKKLAEKFHDPELLWLLYVIIDSCEHGVPIGNYTSQYLNNLYFSDLDHKVKECWRVKAYFRYCDDIIAMSNNKKQLHAFIRNMHEEMARLHVCLKNNWQVYNIEAKGIDFIGYIIRRGYTKVRKQVKQSFIEKVYGMDMQNLSERDANILGSYWGIFFHADCRNLWYKYVGMKSFSDLGISVHPRKSVSDITGIPLEVKNTKVFQKKGNPCLRIECSFDSADAEGNKVRNGDVYITSSGEMLIEATKQMNLSCYPFSTVIQRNDGGYFEFT